MKKLKVNNYNVQDYNNFKNKSLINCDISFSEKDSDYSWIPIFENYIPNLEAIVRNPRRFIQSDENLVPIEKAKKFGEESIKHLAQNTNLIQSVDNDGMPQPLKILNIYKEETYDLYENRFIASLINNLYLFINMHYEKLKKLDINDSSNEKSVTYTIKTNINKKEFLAATKINIKEEPLNHNWLH